MAIRNGVNNEAANDMMKDTFGLSADDLGMDREDSLADLDLGDDGGEGEGGDGDEANLSADDLPGNQQDQINDDNRGQQQQREVAPKKDDKKPDDLSVTHTPQNEFDHGKPKYDKRGNILGSDGKVIATAGREARMYTSLHQTREKLNNTVAQANTIIGEERGKLKQAIDIGISVAQKLTAIQEIGQLHTKAGLNDQDLRQAIDFASAFKANPIEGLKKILTQAAASGIDLTTLGLQPGGFDTKALLDLIRTEIGTVTKPIQAQSERETAQQSQQRVKDEAVTKATSDLNAFLTAEPDARQYLPVFQEIYKNPQFQNMSLGEVWARIQLNLLKNAQQPGNQNRQPVRQQRSPNRQQPRLPNGRGNPPDTGGGRLNTNELAPVSDSYEDILRSVLTATGTN